MSFADFSTSAGLQAFDNYIASKRYIQGYLPTTLDLQALSLFSKPPSAEYTHALRYYNHISAFSEQERKTFRAGGDVPAQIAGTVKATTVAAAAPTETKTKGKDSKAAPSPAPAAASSSSTNNAALEEEIKKQGEVVRDLKAKKADKATIDTEVKKLLALKDQLKAGGSAPAPAAAPAPAPTPAKEEKKEKKEEKKDDKQDDKLLKVVQKEGGKKGQDIIGVHEMGGLEFFCTSVDTPDGDLALVNACLDAMNVEIDENAEEKRGGAACVGKMIFSAGVEQLAMVARIPEDKTAKVDVAAWMKVVTEKVGGHVVGTSTSTYAQGVVPADKDKGRFPIKLKDLAIAAAVEYLQQKGCFPQSTGEDSDSDVCYGDDAFDGFE